MGSWGHLSPTLLLHMKLHYSENSRTQPRSCIMHCQFRTNEQAVGPTFGWSIYHLLDIDDPLQLFPISYSKVGRRSISNLVSQIKKTSTLPRWKPSTAINPKPQPLTVKNGLRSEEAVLLRDIAQVIRSKDSGPFELTFDVLFDSKEAYDRVRAANLLTADTVKTLFHIGDKEILALQFFEPALGWKCTIARPWAQGSLERETCWVHSSMCRWSIS
ncbi:uncharacterized protein PV07_08011 [Cladophialophora immunda]|uniref:DUF4387 domain-containing protein n=1 Tax=Cladophialophora immunda TaxID=569365 RepID=A0A0D2CBA9_9EURO|nr:uncharacterized protein PV07_08011 [Cladophialophora immunda]KIW28338.1 hypothetical protein PV07_08011 [Cladophialophora immunda]